MYKKFSPLCWNPLVQGVPPCIWLLLTYPPYFPFMEKGAVSSNIARD